MKFWSMVAASLALAASGVVHAVANAGAQVQKAATQAATQTVAHAAAAPSRRRPPSHHQRSPGNPPPPPTPLSAPAGSPGVPTVPPTLPDLGTFESALSLHPHLGLGNDTASILARQATLDAIAACGVRLLRLDPSWERLEPSRGAIDLTLLHQAVDDAETRGIECLMNLGGGTSWASHTGDGSYPPDDPTDFAVFCGQVAKEFQGQVRRYEIGNEPNVGFRFWKPTWGGDPVAYGALLAAATDAIHAADPAAQVSFAGVFGPGLGVPPGAAFMELTLDAHPELASKLDAYAYHPYRYPETAPEDLPLPIGADITLVDAVLAHHNLLGKPVWVTEMGWHTALQASVGPLDLAVPVAGGVSEDQQADYLVRGALLSLEAGACMFNVYDTWEGPDPTYSQEDAFGVLHAYQQGQTVAPKPAYGALRTLAIALQGAKLASLSDVSGGVGGPPGTHALRFEGGAARRVTVLWTETLPVPLLDQVAGFFESLIPNTPLDTAHVQIDSGASYAQVLDRDGNVVAWASPGQGISVTTDSHPRYVVEH